MAKTLIPINTLLMNNTIALKFAANIKWFLRVFLGLENVSLIDAAWNSHTTYQVYEYNYMYLLEILWQDASVWGKNTTAQNKITQKDMTTVADHWHSCTVADTTC